MADLIVPPGVDMFQSMRSVGYTLNAAIADLVDNSIDAQATLVQIYCDAVAGRYIALLDNGDGMARSLMIEALRMSGETGHDPSEVRLGRFGLGLKTASLSQGRRLVVVSKTQEGICGLVWDLDVVIAKRDWILTELDEGDLRVVPEIEQLLELDTGTLVVIEKLDVLLGDTPDPGLHLAGKINSLSEHLGLTFQRFIDARSSAKFRIAINGITVSSIDPFLESNPKTQVSPAETIKLDSGLELSFQAFNLPHHTYLTNAEKQRPDLSTEMRDFQGFYIYRNRRLITRGHWFGLAPMNELSKQTRVRVDLPRSLDASWQVDIKKSQAEPPASFKAHIKRLISSMVDVSKRIHKFRGRKQGQVGIEHVWEKVADRDGVRYEINLRHPLVVASLATIPSQAAEQVQMLLKLASQSFPFLDLYQELGSNTTIQVEPVDEDLLRARLQTIKNLGDLETAQQAFSYLAKVEPFNTTPDLESIVNQIWDANESK